MQIALVHHHYDKQHLAEVIEQMKILGAPTIRVVDLGEDRYQALEGYHRLRACEELGISPELEIVDWQGDLDLRALGLQFEDPITMEELCDDSYLATWLEF